MAALAEVRQHFQELLSDEKVNFDPVDLERLKDDKYINRVLRHSENETKDAADLLFDIFEWRKNFHANEITENNINMDYIKEGLMFPRGRDVDGCMLMIVKCKLHFKKKKDFEEVKRCIVYWFDRVEREENGNRITLFLDFEDSGIANVDLELINFLMMLFKSYYPCFLNYILIYQVPWLMNPGLKLVKSTLPARAADKMKFVNQDNLKDYVAPDQALTCWGGSDDYVFEFVPEKTEPAKKVTFANEHENSALLKIPADIILTTEAGEVTGQFTIKNLDKGIVSFKIRTTSPEKFRVRPSSGILSGGGTCTVNITVQQGFQLRTASRDKFLVQALAIPKADVTQRELADIWSKATVIQIKDYQLKCLFPERDHKPLDQASGEAVLDVLTKILASQENTQKDIDLMKNVQTAVLFTLIFTAIVGLMTQWCSEKGYLT